MSEIITKALKVLNDGGVMAHATDTCYGFACDVFNRRALARLYKIKKMDKNKPVSILVSDFTMAKKYGFFNKSAIALAKKYWPGAVTLIVKRKKSLPDFLNPKAKSVGIRVPGHKLSLELVKKLGRPITTTSANITTLPSPYSVSAIRKQFRGQKLKPDYIIDSGSLDKTQLPSTIVDVTSSKIKIVRQGSVHITLDDN